MWYFYVLIYNIFRLTSWFSSNAFRPLYVRLGDFSYHLSQLVECRPVVDLRGVRLLESLAVGMKIR